MSGRRISAWRLRRWLRSSPRADPAKLFRLGTPAREDLAWRAHRLLEKGRPAEAERIYELLTALWPSSHAPAALGLGACRQSQGDLEGAERHYDSVLALEPDNPFALANRAEVYLLTHRPEQAVADLDRAMRRPDQLRADLAERVERLGVIAASAREGSVADPRA
jgi:tetratricopeptide (TPR) repeat protein